MKNNHEVLESRTSKIWIDETGILRVFKKPVEAELHEDAVENLNIIEKLTKDKSHIALVDLSMLKSQHATVIRHYASVSKKINCKAVAFLTSDIQSTYLGINNLIISESKIPAKIFSSEEFAIEWLLKFK